MKKFLFLLVAFSLIAVVPASAGSRHPQRATIVKLSRQVKTLRQRLHASKTRNAQAKAALQASLTSSQNELSAANAQVAALQAKLDAIPAPSTAAIELVRQEVVYAQGGNATSYSPQLVAEAAMDYTFGHVLSPVLGYLEQTYNEPPSGGPHTPGYMAPVDVILAAQAGVCVQHERVFAHIVQAFGFQVRDVGFSYTEPNGSPNAHSTAEVYYDGGWHWYDPTFGVFFKDANGNVLSIADARAGLGQQYKDDAAFENQLAPNATWFETDPKTYVSYSTQLP